MRARQEPPAYALAALDEVKAYLRITQEEDDALIGGLIRSAGETCERFIGRALVLREAEETVPLPRQWRRLTLTPVAAITGVTGLPQDGDPFALPVEDYAIDIDGHGDGWVRVTDGGQVKRVWVVYQAGFGPDWNAVPEPLRQGIVRLVAHLFTHRDAVDDPGPPAAVTALWRPWRRMRLT